MMKLRANQTNRMNLRVIVFILLIILLCVDARLGKSNIFMEDDEDAILDGDFIVLFHESISPISAMNHEDVSFLADELGGKYALQKKTTFSGSLYGFTASNVTKKDLKYLQKESQVFLVEKDSIISIDPLEAGHDKNIRAKQLNKKKRRNKVRTIHGSQVGEKIPIGVQKIGWENVEYDPDIQSRRVFVVDSGLSDPSDELNIDYDLARNFVTNERPNDTTDCNGHGTHVSGIIAAKKNGRHVVGVAAGAVIVPIKVLDCAADAPISTIVAGINYVSEVAYPGDIVNLSVGGRISQQSIDIALKNAAMRTGAIFVVAAGNGDGGYAGDYSPARVSAANVYTVCALNKNQKFVASFSNLGQPPVDVCAPGTNILSLSRFGGTTTKSGTSMAAPHVSGALLLSGGGGSLTTRGFAKSKYDGKRYKIVALG